MKYNLHFHLIVGSLYRVVHFEGWVYDFYLKRVWLVYSINAIRLRRIDTLDPTYASISKILEQAFSHYAGYVTW